MLDLIQKILSTFWDEIITSILDVFFGVLNDIPVPSFMNDIQGYASNLDGATYWLDVLNVGLGMTMVFSAYAIRFGIRRIPFIG